MKSTFKYIALGIALLAFSLMAQAQQTTPSDGVSYNSKGGVATNKKVDPNGNGGYTITLETFATGSTAQIYKSTPVDVILVLDLSSSMTESYGSTTRLAALKAATKSFVAEIARNDTEDDDGNTREKVLGNRIQIITFNSSVTTQFTSFQPASDNLSTINTKIDGFTTSQGTRTDSGVNTAITWVNTSKNATYWTTNNLKTDNDHNIVVVLFTDGCPSTSGSNNFNCVYAKDAVNYAKTIKDNGATVFSVGLINWSSIGGETSVRSTAVKDMMNHISSNYPDGQATGAGVYTSTSSTSSSIYFNCTGNKASSDYYADANEVDLTEIFESIAQASGGSAAEVGTSSEIRDVVTSSFVIPDGFEADDVIVEVWDVDEDGNGWTQIEDYDISAINPEIGTNDDGNNTLTVKGFDFSKDDTKDAQGYTTRENAGNWVGQRYANKTTTFWAGKKLVIKFDIDAKEGVTGGDATQTNASGSGVWVIDKETGKLTCINEFTIPVTNLPVNIVIKKDGLRHGESATFEIHRFEPLKDDDGNILYNAIGKPRPDPETEKNFTKVILTNKGADGALVTKTLKALDPSYIYSVIEDDWGWAYTLTGTVDGVVVEEGSQNTSTVAVNPFTFHNEEKKNLVKHAEAVTINHFATSATGSSSVETYKSSKVKSF